MKNKELTYVEINLRDLIRNINGIRKLTGPGVKFMAVVKADAYGHGAVKVSRAAEKSVDYLAVATLAEAIELKKARIKKPIMLLSETPVASVKDVVRNGLVQTAYTYEFAKALSNAASRSGKIARVHIKIDTGMGRIGAGISEARGLIKKISSLPGIHIEGVFTHFARADEQNLFTSEQLKKFRSVVSRIDPGRIILHAANSAAALYHKESHLGMVRVGLSMYGIYPKNVARRTVDLKPVLEFKTHIVYMKRVGAGTPISYGSTFITKRPTTIATLPVGYADGLPRALSNKGHVLIRGKRYPIVGRVCMDLTMVDVGDSNVRVGEEAVLIGRQGKEMISVDEVAGLADTISYEIICGIGKRVPRIYKR